MTQLEQKIEQFQAVVGFDACAQFEREVASAVLDLVDSLQHNFVDNETKINYATHVFAQMLDDLADLLEKPKILN